MDEGSRGFSFSMIQHCTALCISLKRLKSLYFGGYKRYLKVLKLSESKIALLCWNFTFMILCSTYLNCHRSDKLFQNNFSNLQ